MVSSPGVELLLTCTLSLHVHKHSPTQRTWVCQETVFYLKKNLEPFSCSSFNTSGAPGIRVKLFLQASQVSRTLLQNIKKSWPLTNTISTLILSWAQRTQRTEQTCTELKKDWIYSLVMFTHVLVGCGCHCRKNSQVNISYGTIKIATVKRKSFGNMEFCCWSHTE